MRLKKSILKLPVYKKKVLLCVDYNIPLGHNQEILNSFRIHETLETINYLLAQDASIIIISHIGRPKGPQKELSLKPVADYLAKISKHPVHFLNSSTHETTLKFIKNVQKKSITMLENLRFYEEEKKNDLEFSKRLASYADFYINDAFSTLHRNQASTLGIPKLLPSAFGFLIQKEANIFFDFINKPIHQKAILLGGSKISTKITYLENLLDKAQILIFGGMMSYTMLKALKFNVASSFIEKNYISYCKNIFNLALKHKTEIILPLDHIVTSPNFKTDRIISTRVTENENINEGEIGVDIGPKTLQLIFKALLNAKNIFWNGPFGIFEYQQFAQGTKGISCFLAQLKNSFKIVGGGNTINAIQNLQLETYFNHLSTGGGASLSFIAQKGNLPTIKIIEDGEF